MTNGTESAPGEAEFLLYQTQEGRTQVEYFNLDVIISDRDRSATSCS